MHKLRHQTLLWRLLTLRNLCDQGTQDRRKQYPGCKFKGTMGTLFSEELFLLGCWHSSQHVLRLGEHEESFSTAFKQFKTMGAAGNIEFSFAVLGILMKAATVFCSNTKMRGRFAESFLNTHAALRPTLPAPGDWHKQKGSCFCSIFLPFIPTQDGGPKKSGPQNGGNHL